MKKTHAFTLIELLVVISIIAILAGFALPVFGSALERGRATEDRNNLSGLGKGIMQYRNDTDDQMFSLQSSGQETWPNLLRAKYIKDWKAFRSPFDKVTSTRPRSDINTTTIPVSYGLNQRVFDTFVGRWRNSESLVILAAPAVDPGGAGKQVRFAGDAFASANVKVNPTGDGTALGTHQSRQSINVLFADGHAEQMDWANYSRNQTDLERIRWDPMYESTQQQPQ